MAENTRIAHAIVVMPKILAMLLGVTVKTGLDDAPMKNRRRTLIVDKDFQYIQISKAILTMIILGNAALIVLLLLLKSEAVRILDLKDAAILASVEFLMVIVIFYLGLRATHRISGPALAVKKALGRLGDGDFTTRISLRETDHLHDISAAFNTNVERLDSKLSSIHAQARSLTALLHGDENAEVAAMNLEKALAAFNTRDD